MSRIIAPIQLTGEMSSQSTSACSQAESSDATSVIYKKAVKSLALVVQCVTCASVCHVACLVNNFVSSNGGALKTSMLSDFLSDENFLYTCQCCVASGNALPIDKCSRQSNKIPHLRSDIANLLLAFNIMSVNINSVVQKKN